MTHQEAFTILGLSSRPSSADLDTAFRSLVKTFHPDKNLNRANWSHERTVELNEAYEVAKLYIQTRPETASPSNTEAYNSGFYTARESLLEGIHIYYNFSLQNIHLRREGVRRLRYRTVIRHLQKGIQNFVNIAEISPSPNHRKHAELMAAFTRSFLENVQIEKTFIADGSLDHKAYKNYETGSRLLDSLIKNRFYPGEFPNSVSSPKDATLCEKHFFIILTQFQKSTWLSETVVKFSLLESLLSLIKFEAGMVR